MAEPTLDEIAKDLRITREQATELKAVLKKAEKASDPNEVEDALDFANTLLDGHGVEALKDEDAWGTRRWDEYFQDTLALYVNMGDTYNATVVYDTELGEFHITDWGSWLEEYQKNMPKFFFIDYALTDTDDATTTYAALVRADSKAEALENFIDIAVKMGDDTVWDEWPMKFGDPKVEHSGDNVYYIVGDDPDKGMPEEGEEYESDTVLLAVGKVSVFDRLDEAKEHERETGHLIMYESVDD